MTKEELLQSIEPGMDITEDFIKSVYGYTLTDSEYAADVVLKLGTDGERFLKEYSTYVDKSKDEQSEIYRSAADRQKSYAERSGKRVSYQKKLLESVGNLTAEDFCKSLIQRIQTVNQTGKYNTFDDIGVSGLFAEIFKSECRYSPTVKDWMHFDGIKWSHDKEGMKVRQQCKQLMQAFLVYEAGIPYHSDEERQRHLKRANTLMNHRSREITVKDAKDVYPFLSEELDADDYLLNVQNGTLDLHGDKPIFRDHKADDLISKVCNVDYDPSATCPRWEQALQEIFESDTGKISYLQRLLGYCLTGCTKEEQMYFLFGSTSRNGKSTITETMLYILGDYGATITPETLAIKQNKDSRTASPDIAKLQGARLVIASEPPKRMLFDSALVKTLTGRDQITARHLYQDEVTFLPRFKLVVNTNYLPTISDPTIFLSGRIKVLSFNKHFTEQEQDKMLKEKLRCEAPGILNWMIEGYFRYKAEGLEPPESVIDATEEYAADSDKLQKFIDDCLLKADANCKGSEVYKVYERWTAENGYGCESKGNFFSDLKTKGIFRASGRVNGVPCKNIIHGYMIDDFSEVPQGEATAFDQEPEPDTKALPDFDPEEDMEFD